MPGVQIIGGGNNRTARVNEDNKLETVAVVTEPEHHANINKSDAYVIPFSVTPEAESVFFYMKNESETNMVIENLTIYSESEDNRICIFRNPTGDPSDVNNVTPVNNNFGSSKQAVGQFYYGENLGDIGGTRFESIFVEAGKQRVYEIRNWIVMPKNATIALCSLEGSTELWVDISIIYISGELI